MTAEERIVRFMIEKQGRMASIFRFATVPSIHRETVAEHSYHVAFLTMLVGDYLKARGWHVNELKMISMALIHDIEEVVSGDVLGPLKRGKFKEELEKLNARGMEFLCHSLGEDAGEHYKEIWNEYRKGETIEAATVKFLDLMAILVHSVKEVHSGNRYFRELLIAVAGELVEYLNSLQDSEDGGDGNRYGTHLQDIAQAFYDYVRRYLEGDKELLEALEVCLRVEALR